MYTKKGCRICWYMHHHLKKSNITAITDPTLFPSLSPFSEVTTTLDVESHTVFHACFNISAKYASIYEL